MEKAWAKRQDDIKSNFEYFDNDSNGLIDFKEFQSLLQTLSPEATTQQAAEGFSMIDTNSDGSIDLGEFTVWWKTTWWEY